MMNTEQLSAITVDLALESTNQLLRRARGLAAINTEIELEIRADIRCVCQSAEGLDEERTRDAFDLHEWYKRELRIKLLRWHWLS